MESDNPGHQPEMFEEFELAKDGSGFFLTNGEFYPFDKNGGFYDKYNNYYNADGQPATPPDNDEDYEDVPDDEEDQERSEDSAENDPKRQIERDIENLVDEYEGGEDVSADEYEDYEELYEQIQEHQKRKSELKNEVLNSQEKEIDFLIKYKSNDVAKLKQYLQKASKEKLKIIDASKDPSLKNTFYIKCDKSNSQVLIELHGKNLDVWLKNIELEDEYESVDEEETDATEKITEKVENIKITEQPTKETPDTNTNNNKETSNKPNYKQGNKQGGGNKQQSGGPRKRLQQN